VRKTGGRLERSFLRQDLRFVLLALFFCDRPLQIIYDVCEKLTLQQIASSSPCIDTTRTIEQLFSCAFAKPG
jgi:hypothetical protein